MRYHLIKPPAILQNHVRHFWLIDFNNTSYPDTIIDIFADQYPRLIFQDLNGHAPVRTTDNVDLPAVFLSGIITKNNQYLVGGAYSHLGISFYPHAVRQFFNIDNYELINQLPDLKAFCPDSLIDRLQNAQNHKARMNILVSFFVSKVQQPTKQDYLVKDFIHPT